jgi:hypothetical protein
VLRVAFMRMSCAHQVHGNVRIDENHCCEPIPYPRSISASMPSISLTG